MAFFEDNMMRVDGGITHFGADLTCDEDMTPTILNTIVVLWLQSVHAGQPQMVKKEIRVRTQKQITGVIETRNITSTTITFG